MSTARQTTPASSRRQRHVDPSVASNGSASEQKVQKVTATQSEKNTFQDTNPPWTFARLVGVGAATVHMSAPYYISLAVMSGLIFGGCCSNVRIRL